MNDLEKKVVEALKKVKDPETNMDILAENLVYGFTINDKYIKVFVSFEASTSTCNFCRALSWIIVDKISEQIVRALKEIGFEGVEIVEELNPKIVYKIG
jgi:metal-sulfur cluster biosynthetic enzyme